VRDCGRVVPVAVLAALAASSCGLLTPFEVLSVHDADGDADGDADQDGDADADGSDGDATDADVPSGSGPLVLVVREILVVPERVCDVDDNGTLDNSVADVGEGAEVLAYGLNAALVSALDDARYLVLHFKHIDELAGPDGQDLSLATYMGRDMDSDHHPDDDFSGEEPYYASSHDLDKCGEPRSFIEDVHIEGGAISGRGGIFRLDFARDSRGLEIAELTGNVEPWGASFDVQLCGVLPIPDIRDVIVPIGESDVELTLLEVLLNGGATFGTDTVPGLLPNIDRDGDGLERFNRTSEGFIASCVDGDRTLIEGRGCWADPRMADAFSLTVRMVGVSARYGGRDPGWEYMVTAECEGGPPPESFFSTVPPTDPPCVALNEVCDSLALQPCCDAAHRCSGADGRDYRCLAPCEPSACLVGARLAGCQQISGGPHCGPSVDDPLPAECTPGEEAGATEGGETEDTVCVERAAETYCAQRCTPETPPCGTGGLCAPLLTDTTAGVCANR